MPHLVPTQVPCFYLLATVFADPRLLGTCPHCSRPLKFNPFVVDCRKG